MAGTPFTRWHAAGLVRRLVPDVRGRDRLFTLVRGSGIPAPLAGEQTLRFGPGLQATVRLADDGSFADLFFCRYEDPTLVPVLEEVLSPGDTYFDVGANIGIYALWASRLVGDTGRVVAFEPVPGTRRWLEALVDQNGAANVTVVPAAVSAAPGEVTIEVLPSASGRSHVTTEQGPARSGASTVTVETVTVDQAVGEHGAPALIKIDVEGHEGSVINGMARTLTQVAPAVVFEAPDSVGVAGETARIIGVLEADGYRVYSLTPHGLVPASSASFSHNLLALHLDRHADVRDRLARHRFHRNQNC